MTRKLLPARRHSETFEFEAGVPGYSRAHFIATVGYYAPGGGVGEIFIHPQKTGSDRDIVMQEAAIAASFALQYGAQIEDLRKAMPRTTDGQPEGPIGTLLDLLAVAQEKEKQRAIG
jgi:hypothetical protein